MSDSQSQVLEPSAPPPPAPARADPPLIPPALVLPDIGVAERASLRAAKWAALLWGAYLIVLHLFPAVWRASVAILDFLLWPMVRALDNGIAVALIALVTALVTALCQRCCTDVPRLRDVKSRTQALIKALRDVPANSPQDKAITAMIRSGEWRIARATFVPLALLLGPVLLTFMWLPPRVDPVHINPAPGAGVRIQASIDGEFNGLLQARVDGASLERSAAPAQVDVLSVRRTFDELRRELAQAEQGLPLTPAAKEHLETTRKSPAEARAALEAFLANPMPPRILQWNLTTAPDLPGTFTILLQAGENGESGTARASLSTGNHAPPPLDARDAENERMIVSPGQGVIHDLRLHFADPRPPTQRAFWQPFAWAGWSWDAGWLSLYLLVYIPAMFAAKKLLHLP